MSPTSINGYKLTTPFTTTGGGHCKWAFARRDGEEYFIKQFLMPTYPLPDGPGSEKTKAIKRGRCERFARQHQEVKERLAPLSGPGGNLVVALDFFLHGAHYYKVTAKVNAGADWMADIAALSTEDKITLMMKVTNSLDILHKQKLVHGDIKPPNILVERSDAGLATKLIDFDNCFVPGVPPPPDELVGDLVYYPPEMIDYMVETGPAGVLTEKADIFALGLTFAEYVDGAIPRFPADCKYPGEAARRGEPLVVAESPFRDLLTAMLDADPVRRPGCPAIRDILQMLRRALSGRTSTLPIPTIPAPGPSPETGTLTPAARPAATGLQGKLFSQFAKAAGETPAEPATRPTLRGRLAPPSRSDDAAATTAELRGRLVTGRPSADPPAEPPSD